MQKKLSTGISICIPNWNHRSYLCRSVRSALDAARELAGHGIDCEVLVLDDCSRDGSQRLLLRLAMMDTTGCLHAITSQPNQGLGPMRNLSLAEARYRWICFLDADNDLVPENLVHFYRAAQETGAAMVYGNIIVKTAGPEGDVLDLISNDVIHEGLLQKNYIDAMAVIDAEQVFAVGGYPLSRTTAEDWEIVLHLVAEDRQVVFLPLLLGHWYLQPNSLGSERGAIDHPHIYRTYNQRQAGLPDGFQPRMYHPEVGYLV